MQKDMKQQTRDWVAIVIGIGVISILLSQTGCGQGPQGIQGLPGTNAPETATVDPAIQSVVNAYNENHPVNDPITQGLACTLYTVPTSTLQILASATGVVPVVPAATLTTVGSFLYTGEFNQPEGSVTGGFNVLPSNLQGLYQTWFIVKCTGLFISTYYALHEFDLTSDDGSVFSIGGQLINNDGLHAAATKSASKILDAETVYSFEVDFFQGGGDQELVLNMDGALLPSQNLYH
jgi:hypothetical protein